MRRAGGLATRGRGVRASGPKQGGGSGQRAWLQKQVVPAIERSGLEEGGRAEGGGAGSQLGCHVSPRLRTLTHWGEPVRLLPAPASKARRRPRGAAPPPRRIHRSCSFSAPRLPRPSESAAQVTDRTGVEGWLQSRHQPRPSSVAAGANKGIPFLSHRGCSSRHQPRVLTAESEAGTARCTQPLTAAPLHCNRHVSPPFSLSPSTSSSSSSSSSHKGSNWEPLHQQSLGGRRDCIWSNEATRACLETLTHFAPPSPTRQRTLHSISQIPHFHNFPNNQPMFNNPPTKLGKWVVAAF